MMFLRRVYNYFIGDVSFLKDNLLLFSSITALNFLSYLYHFVIGRSLGPADYGVFGTLFSLIYFLIVPFNTIQTTFSHFVSGLRSEGKFGEISYLLKRGFLRMLLYASITVILFFIINRKELLFINLGNYRYCQDNVSWQGQEVCEANLMLAQS